MIGGVFAVASVAGPLLGGLLVDQLSWRWVFYVNLPVGAAALAVIVARLPRSERAERRPVDVLGGLLLTAAASAIVLVTSWGGGEYAWDSPTIIALALTGAGSLAALIARERRAADPVLPLSLFANRAFTAAGLSAFLVGVSMFGLVTFLPLYLQVVDGASATEAGLRMLPFVIGSLIAATISGKVISKTDNYKPYPVAGGLLMVLGVLMLAGLDEHTSAALTTLYMLIVGLGVGLVMQTVILIAQNSAPREHIGVATSTATLARSLGASIGVAMLGAIFATRLSSELGSVGPAGERIADTGARLDPQQVHALPAAIEPDVIDAFTGALQHTFLVATGVAALTLLALLLLPGQMWAQTDRRASVGGSRAARSAG
jgi:EmrB/QacA subfamily drug resistance transporter